jgi:succinoglycan biosynthesis transport protein ExoP
VKWDDRNDFNPLKSGAGRDAGIDLIRPFLTSLWAEKRIILGCTVVMSLLGALYVSQRSPNYTARGLLLVENTRLEAGRQELLPAIGSVDTSAVDSQVEIIKSEAIALKVIEALKLTENKKSAVADTPSWVAQTHNPQPTSGSDGDVARDSQKRTFLAALPDFTSRLSVRRIGLSSVIEVGYRGSSPEGSARIVNEVIRTYLADQAASAVTAAASASAWLRDRIKDLGSRTRVVSLANPPARKDGPRRLALLGVFSGFGFLLGIGIAVVRHALDTTLRDPSQAKAKLDAPFLGAVANFHPSAEGRLLKKAAWPNLRQTSDLSGSDLAALVRRIKAATAARGAGPIIGVTSATPGEGTTIIAANLAFSAAAAGLSVLLVDSNAYKPDLSCQLAPGASKGLADIFAGRASLNEARLIVGETGLHFLPSGSGGPIDPGFSRSHVKTIVREWVEEYDLVVVDLPPLVPVPELGLGRNVVDGIVLVVEWGRVPTALVETALAAAGLSQKDLLGFVLNKVNRSATDRFTFPLESYRWKHAGTTYTGYPGGRDRADVPPDAPTDLRRMLLCRIRVAIGWLLEATRRLGRRAPQWGGSSKR